MKRLLVIVILLLLFTPITAQDTAPFATVEPETPAPVVSVPPVVVPDDVPSQYETIIAALCAVIALLGMLAAFLGYKVSSLIPPEAVSFILHAAATTPSKQDDLELRKLFTQLGFDITESNGVITAKPKTLH